MSDPSQTPGGFTVFEAGEATGPATTRVAGAPAGPVLTRYEILDEVGRAGCASSS